MTDTAAAAAAKPLKIVRLVAENVKKISAVSITPSANLVQLTGKNRSGKTSTLDAIWWALAGTRNVQAAPIRTGQQKATIKLDMGELIATRTFTRQEDNSFNSTITVENGEGARFGKPQQMLDSLLGALTFDPLAFARMPGKEQFEALTRFVPGVDFGNIDGLNKRDFDKRADINREVKALQGQVAGIVIPDAVPGEKVDEAELIKEIGEVGEHNARIERRREGREAAAKEVESFRAAAVDARDNAAQARRRADEFDALAVTNDGLADALERKLAEAESLPEPKSASEVTARLEQAKTNNALSDRVARRAALQADVDAKVLAAKALTDTIDQRNADKREAIAKAKMPVDGLGFGEECITLNGVPFNQASDAEQLRASIGIAMAANPRLRVIRVRDGSLLDDDGMKLLADMADKADCQVWVESVDSTGKVGIVLEDGHVASTPESRGDKPAIAQAAE